MAILIGSNFSVSTNLHIDDRAIMATITARDEIPAGRRYLGMQVFVEENSTNYQLLGGLENTNWVKMSDADGSYTHPDGDGNLHVPATGTDNAGKVLMAGSTAGEMAWTALPVANTTTAGIVKLTNALDLDDETIAASAKAAKLLKDAVDLKLDAAEVTTTAQANKVLKLNADAKLVADVVGNADTASKLHTAQDIALAGAVTGTAQFDGSTGITLETTLKDSGVLAGQYSKVTVDAKGIVTAAEQLTVEDLGTITVGVGSEQPLGKGATLFFHIEE